MKKEAVAIITARGGSKRIPRKNIREFCGKPILAYSIEAALESGVFDEVMVSTEDREIAEIAKKYGAEVPFMRSNKNSDDYASTVDVVKEVLDTYTKLGQNFQKACCIYPTAPFVTGEKICTAMKLLENADSVIPVVKFSFSPFRSVIIKEGIIKPMWSKYMSCRSQDLPELYHDCGQFYCFWTEKFQKENTLIMEKTVPYELNEWEVQDIDTTEDWKMAELKYQCIIKSIKISEKGDANED